MRTHALNGEEIVRSSGTRRMDFEVMNSYLNDLKRAFDKHPVPFFLFFGTLVGAIRDEDFVATDDDADVGVLLKDEKMIREDVVPILKEYGYSVNFSSVNGRTSQFYISKNDVAKHKIDVYFLWPFRGRVWFPRYTNIKGKGPVCVAIPYDKKYFENMDTIKFKGSEYKVPTPPEEFLEKLWGEWWVHHGGQFGKIKAEIFPVEEFKPDEN